jgi:CheY-like chemotaxis protein
MKKILLIEDEEPFASNLKEELKEYGLVVTKIDNGEDAIQALIEDIFQGVILDLKLKASSEIHGISLIEWLKKFQPNIPIIVITGHSHLAIRAFEYGVDALMIKPVEGKYISQYLKRAIEFRELKVLIQDKEVEIMNSYAKNVELNKENRILKSVKIYNAVIIFMIVVGLVTLTHFFPNNILSPILLFIISLVLLIGGHRISKVILKILGQEVQIESEPISSSINSQKDNIKTKN